MNKDSLYCWTGEDACGDYRFMSGISEADESRLQEMQRKFDAIPEPFRGDGVGCRAWRLWSGVRRALKVRKVLLEQEAWNALPQTEQYKTPYPDVAGL